MRRDLLDHLRRAQSQNISAALVTRPEDGAQAIVYETATGGALRLPPDALAKARDYLRRDESGMAETSAGSLFIRAYNPPWQAIIIGAVHITQSLVPMASLAGFSVAVIDPRRAFAAEERWGDVTVLRDWPDEALQKLAPSRRSAVITLTHDPKLDDPALEAALRSPSFYIAALGSTRTHAQRLQRLQERGWEDKDLARIHGPAGLRIGAKSPAEIAVSVLAQMIQNKHEAAAL